LEVVVVKRNELPSLSEAQLEIMNLVWDRGEVTVGEVWTALSERRSIARNTVQTMMVRLEAKGWLRHRTVAGAFLYSPAVPRKATQKRMVKQLLETAFEGSAEGLVMALLGERSLTQDEADRIRDLIDKATMTWQLPKRNRLPSRTERR
jgi:predicted transcriptional regulator